MKLVIDRKTWLRGEGVDNSYLLRGKDGRRCCLGFLASQCGILDEYLMRVEAPNQICDHEAYKKLPNFLFNEQQNENSSVCCKLMIANDLVLGEVAENGKHGEGVPKFNTESEREEWITKKFAEHGIEVVFEN